MPPARRLAALAAAFVVAAVLWWTQADTGDENDGAGSSGSSSSSSELGTDPDSSLPWIAQAQLPPEAQDTLQLIDDGGPYPYDEDDSTFGNREGILPDREQGYYREYTVDTPGLGHRGAKRIVTGAGSEFYWTQDHYSSFSRIKRDDS